MLATIVITILVLALLAAAVTVHRYVDRTYAQPTRDLSRMMSVRLTTANALSAHYKQHGSFPRSLSELPLQSMHWGDEGSSIRDLDSWHYRSDGPSFTMAWVNAHGPDLFLGGNAGQVFYLRD